MNRGSGPATDIRNWRPLLRYNASMGGIDQIASITAVLLLIPPIGFMLLVERFLKADVLAIVGRSGSTR